MLQLLNVLDLHIRWFYIDGLIPNHLELGQSVIRMHNGEAKRLYHLTKNDHIYLEVRQSHVPILFFFEEIIPILAQGVPGATLENDILRP